MYASECNKIKKKEDCKVKCDLYIIEETTTYFDMDEIKSDYPLKVIIDLKNSQWQCYTIFL